jgi:diguanylate cyclase (GGDEF)-like protein
MGQPDDTMSALTMNDIDGSGPAPASRNRHRILRALIVLAVLPLPFAVCMLGVHVLPKTGVGDIGRHFLRDQALLILGWLVVTGVGGFLIWSTAASLAEAAVRETSRKLWDERPTDRVSESASLSSSVTRMLGTIERQADEITQFAGQLDRAHRELESARAQLGQDSFVDAATGLYNERFFVVRLEQEVARYHRFGHPLSLVLIELHGLRAAGDKLGTAAGDQVLREVVAGLLKSSRGVDVICRHGDSELAALLVETPLAEAGAYASRIRDTVSTCLWGHGEQVTASFGTAALPDGASSGHDLVRAAADALAAARRAGRNCVATYGGPGAESSEMREMGAP